MKKSAHVLDKHDQHYPDKLEDLEGTVEFSHRNITQGGFSNLTLRFEDFDGEIWIRGEHRIDVGEKVRVHYSYHCSTSPFVAKAYEIFCEDGSVKFRYCERYCEFTD